MKVPFQPHFQLPLMSCLGSHWPICCSLNTSCYFKPLNLFSCCSFFPEGASHSLVTQKIPTWTWKFCQRSLPWTVSSVILSILCTFRTFCTWFLPPIAQYIVICLQPIYIIPLEIPQMTYSFFCCFHNNWFFTLVQYLSFTSPLIYKI